MWNQICSNICMDQMTFNNMILMAKGHKEVVPGLQKNYLSLSNHRFRVLVNSTVRKNIPCEPNIALAQMIFVANYETKLTFEDQMNTFLISPVSFLLIISQFGCLLSFLITYFSSHNF